MSKNDIKLFGLVVAAVVTAGYIMNAMRDNSMVAEAIAGFDA